VIYEGPTAQGTRDYSFNPPSGNRIQSLELLEKWTISNTVCASCKIGQLKLSKEADIEGLASKILWRCSNCGIQSFCDTSNKVKFTGIKGEKPKAGINLQAVGGTMMVGSTFRTLQGMMGTMDIPCMTNKTFNRNAKFIGDASVNLAVEVLDANAKLEGELARQNGAVVDSLGRTAISVSYDGNWAKRSYKHSYNSLLGGGWMFGFYSQLPVANFTLNKYCGLCALAKKKRDHDCPKNWDKSAKAMEPEIAVKCSLLLSELGLRVAVIIGDEDATVLSKMIKRLPDDIPGSGHSLCNVEKLSDINHIKKIFTGNLIALWNNKWKHNGLTQKSIDHLANNFGFAIKINKDNLDGMEKALNNLVPHSFGDHSNCSTIGNGTWCHAMDPKYKPQLSGGKYLGINMEEL